MKGDSKVWDVKHVKTLFMIFKLIYYTFSTF